MPTVCGLCPVGCNITATTREGKVKRILSRNHPEIDEGWLCDKGRFAFSHLYARDRVRDPLRRVGVRRFEELSWDDALDEAEQLLRAAGPRAARALRVGDGRAGGRAGALVRQGLDSRRRRPARAGVAGARRVPRAALGDPRRGARRRRRRRAGRGARAGRRPLGQGGSPERRRDRHGRRRRHASRPRLARRPRRCAGARRADARTERAVADLVGRRRRRRRARRSARAAELGAAGRRFYLPATPNGRGGRRGVARGGEGEPEQPDEIGVLLDLRRRGRRDPERAGARRAGGAP